MRAADFVGPNARNFSAAKRSTIPAARGSSGPITVRSMRFSLANRTSAFRSSTEIATFSAISAVPAFPGAQKYARHLEIAPISTRAHVHGHRYQ